MAMYKRPDGMTKELLALTGGAPPLTLAYPSYKDRPAFLKQTSKWSWKPFKNQARSDELELFHWTKEGIQEDEEYPFAKLNKKVIVMEYTDEEYHQYLQDPVWSKEETDYLIELCKRFDLRFFVIIDRYKFSEKQRTMEDIKDRYYNICKLLCQARHTDIAELKQYEYNKEKEVERKQNLEILYSRTAPQAAEEEKLFHELKRRELMLKRWQRERDSLLRLFSTFDSSNAAKAVKESEQPEAPPPVIRRKRKKDDLAPDTPPIRKKERKVSDVSSVPAEDQPPPYPKKDKQPPGAYMRSQKLTVIKTYFLNKMNAMLEELGVPVTRPLMPTEKVMTKYDELRQAIYSLLELKRSLDRREHETKAAKLRIDQLEAMEPEERKANAKMRQDNEKKAPSSPKSERKKSTRNDD